MLPKLKFYPEGNTACRKCSARPCVMYSNLCETHFVERRLRLSPSAMRGAQKRRDRYPERFLPESADKYWAHRAHVLVSAAVSKGVLPSLKDREYACTDCDGIATEYDHRDYSRPLDVEPVCGSCNKRRGTAIWPTADRYQFKRIEEKS